MEGTCPTNGPALHALHPFTCGQRLVAHQPLTFVTDVSIAVWSHASKYYDELPLW